MCGRVNGVEGGFDGDWLNISMQTEAKAKMISASPDNLDNRACDDVCDGVCDDDVCDGVSDESPPPECL